MGILAHDQPLPTPGLTERLKRDIGLHRAAQTLADATRCQLGLRPLPLSQLDARDREWFRQTARNLIEIFETVTTEREPDAVRERREMQEVDEARVLESRLAVARSRARSAARERGHVLGAWQCAGQELGAGHERAECRTCGRTVFIDVNASPCVSGMALIAGCLVAAESQA